MPPITKILAFSTIAAALLGNAHATTFQYRVSAPGVRAAVGAEGTGVPTGPATPPAAAAPTISPWALEPVSYGSSSFLILQPTSASPGTFTYLSDNPSVASVAGNRITIHSAGTTTIVATQAAAGSYAGATVSAPLTVERATPTFNAYTLPFKTMGAASYAIPAPSSNPGGGSYSYASSNSSVATVTSGVVTLVGPGTTTITATRAATVNYNEASTSAVLSVLPAPSPSDSAWNPADKGANMTIISSLVVTGGGPTYQWEVTRANLGKSSGKHVFELDASSTSSNVSCGLASGSTSLVGQLGTTGTAIGLSGGTAVRSTMSTTTGITNGNCSSTVMFAVDLDSGKGWVARSGVWLNNGNPATGMNPAFTFAPNTQLFPAASINTTYSYTVTANFGTKAFVNQVPTGFTAGWY